MRVYYAHCMNLYDTPQEARDVALLRRLGHAVVNPNDANIRNAVEAARRLAKVEALDEGKTVMTEVFEPLVQEQEALAFRALPDGTIPAGVAKEIGWAEAAGLPVFELPSGIRRRTLSVDATRDYLREVGQR